MKRIVIECDLCKGETDKLQRVRIRIGNKGWAGDCCEGCSLEQLSDEMVLRLIPLPKRGRPAKPFLAVTEDAGGSQVCAICDEATTCDETICHEHSDGGLKTECTACAGLKDELLGG